jgi:hypothetical protein
MSRTGYYSTPQGELRHSHQVGDRDLFHAWHNASDVHFDDPTAHANAQSFSPHFVVWAKTNATIPNNLKQHLIAQAKVAHDNILAHTKGTQKINIGCPDCGVIFEGTLVYRGEGKWGFEYECSNSKCSNFQFEYVGTIQEK